jgi:hypothetical protein
LCHACQLGRHVRRLFSSSSSRASKNFDLIHCDLWTSPVSSVSGFKYYLVVLDDCSHFVWTSPSVSNLTPFPPSPISLLMFTHNSVAPSKPCSATMVVNSIIPPFVLFCSPKVFLYACPALHGTLPSYHDLRTFGCMCYPNLIATTPHKLAPRSSLCAFLGYSPEISLPCSLHQLRHHLSSRRIRRNNIPFLIHAGLPSFPKP